jgi:hypothetical protein
MSHVWLATAIGSLQCPIKGALKREYLKVKTYAINELVAILLISTHTIDIKRLINNQATCIFTNFW